MEKLKIKYPIICEGKYDKIALGSVIDGVIIPTDGFGIFNDKEKRILLRKIAEENGVIVLTDSDGAGSLIRSHLLSALPKDKVINLYTPKIKGKEKRKTAPSAEGCLGVEGMKRELLYELFLPYADEAEVKKKGDFTKTDMYVSGLSGKDGSEALRQKLCERLGFPMLTANALLSALNLLYSKEEILDYIGKIKDEENG